jgi:hypothetical protein
MNKRVISKIPPGRQENGIEWIVIQEGLQETEGVYLFLHSELELPSIYDEWYEDLERAQSAALRKWGIGKSEWINQAP